MSADCTTTARNDGDPGSASALARLWASIKAIAVGATESERTQRDAVLAFSVRAASAGLLYLTQVALARWMGAHDYGVYVFIWTWVMVLGGISHAGLAMTMLRLLPTYLETGKIELYRGLVMSGRWFAFLAGVAVMLASFVVLQWFAANTTSPYVGPALLIVLCIPFYAVTDVQDGIGRARGWMAVGLVPPYIIRPLVLLVVMAAAHAAGLQTNAVTVAYAAIAGTLVAVVAQMVLMQRRLDAEVGPGPKQFALGSWLTASLPLLVMYLAELVMQNADVLIVSRYLSPEDVGMYFAASKTMALVMFIHYAVGSAAAKQYATLNARDDNAALTEFVHRAVKWTFWPSLAAALGILALGKPLLWMFSPKFVDAYPLMFILAVGYLFRAAMGPAEFLLNTVGEQRLCALVVGFSAALNICLGFLLVPRLGVTGAAISTATALSVAALLNAVVVRRRLGIEVSILSLLRR